MDCTEARKWIDQGQRPGSQSAQQKQLGFHLAQCPDCRAYYEATDPPHAPAVAAVPLPRYIEMQPVTALPRYADTPTAPPQRPTSPARSRRTNPLWYAAIAVWLVLLVGIGWVGGIFWRASQHLDAMIVPPLPTSSVVVPSLTVPPATAQADPANHPPPASALLPGLQPTAPADSPVRSPTAQPAPPEPQAPDVTEPPAPSATPRPEKGTTDDSPLSAPQIGLVPGEASGQPAPTPWPSIQTLPTALVPTPSPTDLAAPPSGEALTILLLGTDRRPGETDVPRTDTIMLLHVDPQRQRLALLSLPRDLWVEIPGFNNARINSAYLLGEVYGAAGGGMALARDTVSLLLGIRVDYVVLIDFMGFIDLIDTLGGVTVHVETELYDDAFPTMDYGYTIAHFLPGPQWMDGSTALTYSRIRHPDSDFMRIRRQQAVIIAIAARLRERGDLQTVLTVDQITGALLNYVRTDLPRERAVGLVWAMRNYPLENVARYSIDERMVTFGVGADRYALVPIPAALSQITYQFLGLQ